MSVEIEMLLDDGGPRFLAHGQVSRVRAANHSLVIALAAVPEALAQHLAIARIEVLDMTYVQTTSCERAQARVDRDRRFRAIKG